MFRAIPTSNKLLAKRWEDHNREIHISKLKSMKPSIDSSTPQQYRHLRSRLKRHQLMEGEKHIDRFTEIERENRILLEKMSTILNTKGREVLLGRPKSLNKESRKRQLLRVTAENQAILKRLQEKAPSYNVQQWEEDRKKQEGMLRMRCEYPYSSVVPTTSNRGNISARPRTYTPSPVSRSLVTQGAVHKSVTGRSKTLTPVNNEKKLVFKKGVNISERYFIVEITSNHQ